MVESTNYDQEGGDYSGSDSGAGVVTDALGILIVLYLEVHGYLQVGYKHPKRVITIVTFLTITLPYL